MNYLIYKITNTVNNKIYIGCHKTNDVNDGYMGSGKILKRAINKHGIDNFTKEILHIFDNPEDMFTMESELVNEEFVFDRATYNLKEGGFGGWDYINNNKLNKYISKEGMDNCRLNGKNAVANQVGRYGLTIEQHKINSKKGMITATGEKSGLFKGHNHKPETKAIIGKKNSVNQKGTGNSQYGTMWITNEEVSKKIKKDQPIPDGFRKGRKMKQSRCIHKSG